MIWLIVVVVALTAVAFILDALRDRPIRAVEVLSLDLVVANNKLWASAYLFRRTSARDVGYVSVGVGYRNLSLLCGPWVTLAICNAWLPWLFDRRGLMLNMHGGPFKLHLECMLPFNKDINIGKVKVALGRFLDRVADWRNAYKKETP